MPEDRLEEAQAAGESAQVVLLQKHLAKALHSSQLTLVCVVGVVRVVGVCCTPVQAQPLARGWLACMHA